MLEKHFEHYDVKVSVSASDEESSFCRGWDRRTASIFTCGLTTEVYEVLIN